MEKIELSTLQKRILSSLIMVPVAIGALWAGHPYVDIMVFVVGALLAWEWSSMVPNQKPSVFAVCYTFALGCALLIFNWTVLFLTLLGTAFLAYIKAKNEKHRRLLTLGTLYISLGVGSLYWLYYLFDAFGGIPEEKGSFVMMLWFMLVVWSVDIGAYFVGSTVKGPKLAPKISPNKTWSGLCGGVISSALISLFYMYLVSHFFNLQVHSEYLLRYTCLGAVIAVVAQIGDLAESAIKRHLQIKDSSSLIPGHGGVFDRIDGLIFAAPFVYFYFTIISL